MHFLVNLNGSFDSVKSQILATEPLPNLHRAYYIASQVEAAQKKGDVGMVDPVAFMARHNGGNVGGGNNGGYAGGNHGGNTGGNNGRKDRKGNNGKKCTHCKEDGHNADQCFLLIGFPDWYKGNKNKKNQKVVAQVGYDTPFDGNIQADS